MRYPNGKGYTSPSDTDEESDADDVDAAADAKEDAEQLKKLRALVQCGIDLASADVTIAQAQQYDAILSTNS